MKIAYIEKKFQQKSLLKIEQANEIIKEYEADGYLLTLRQLYYQFVARGLLNENSLREYSKLSTLISDARLAGLIDWELIEDRTRNLRSLPTWDSPKQILKAAARQYRCDLWKTQDVYIEVWIEKDALIGIVEPVCEDLRIPYIACRGYMSQSEQWAAAQRFIHKEHAGKRCIIFHLGDHDPSGIDMTRDNNERLHIFETNIEVRRLALNYNQVQRYNPPPNPAKLDDPRANDYIAMYGRESWELDALEPHIISDLIRNEWNDCVDKDAWYEALANEQTTGTVLLSKIERMKGI